MVSLEAEDSISFIHYQRYSKEAEEKWGLGRESDVSDHNVTLQAQLRRHWT